MSGLLGGVLPKIFEAGNRARRYKNALLQDPRGTINALAESLAGDINDQLSAPQWGNALRGMPADPNAVRAEQNKLAGLFAGLGIVKPAQAMELTTKRALPESAEFTAAVANTPGAQVTPDGLLMRVMRNQRPEQSLRPSVRGGVFYLPEGSAQAKYYSTGKSGYGGTERITGETLLNNPMFVKGATGGKAPEAAFDQLTGKGSYQTMRQEVLNLVMGYGVSPSQRVALVDEFLDKYAPELSGMGQQIVKNSGQGNQLAYALQEAAVGSAVRRAGHDGVLGYSMTRGADKKPFLSELFDVREVNYPDKFGSPAKIWPDFLP